MAPIIAAIVSSLISNNLPKVAQAVVDKGLDYVEGKLGVKIEADETGKLTPELVSQIKIASMKHEEFKIEHETKRIELEHGNTANARDMQKEALKQDSWFAKNFVYLLASFWSLVTAVYLGAITFATVPAANVRVVDTVTGFLLGTLIATIINYFFGSSNGSSEKNKIMQSMQNFSKEDFMEMVKKLMKDKDDAAK